MSVLTQKQELLSFSCKEQLDCAHLGVFEGWRVVRT